MLPALGEQMSGGQRRDSELDLLAARLQQERLVVALAHAEQLRAAEADLTECLGWQPLRLWEAET